MLTIKGNYYRNNDFVPSYKYEAYFTDSVLALVGRTAELAVGLSRVHSHAPSIRSYRGT
jgi:hypothetical protein